MIKLPGIIGAALVAGVGLTTGWIMACHAATSTTLDILPADIAGPPDKVEVGNLNPLAPGPKPNAARPPATGNPLWSVPLSSLTVTQERPIFAATRRPPPGAVAGARIEPGATSPAPAPAVAERPPLALIGAVVGDRDAIAVFLDRSNQGILRLRAGESHAGWLLSSVLGREVTLTKDDRTEVLVLQREEAPASRSSVSGLPPPTPVAGSTDGAYAPFIPRSTPKNGESDGL
jgi:general secretion pathway protein N